MSRGLGEIQKKVLLILAGGASLMLSSPSPRQYFKTLRAIQKELKQYRRDRLETAIHGLYESSLIGYREPPDGMTELTLNKKGKKQVLAYNLETMRIPVPSRWDRKWRVILFDIPHVRKKARDALRFHLNRLGFYQFQKSVFVYPYPCTREIEFIVALYNLHHFVRHMLVEEVDNEADLKHRFNLH